MAVTVNGVEIIDAEIRAEMDRLREDYERYMRSEGAEPDEAQLREWAIEDLIEEQLVREAARATQPVPSEERVDKELEKNAALYAGLPEEQKRARAGENLQQRRMMKEIRKGAPVPDEQAVREYYEKNPDVFVAPEALRLSHVCRYLKDESKADVYLAMLELKTRLDKGEIDWATALGEHSETFKRDFGVLGTVKRGELPGEAEAKLWKLNAGEISDVIDLGVNTLHLIMVVERLEPQKFKYHEIKEDLKKQMLEQARADCVNARLDELKAAAVIDRGQGIQACGPA
ncbi:MAG: peptidyl-prolyl cis-trans isomerase [Kiritimatiellae bacterium]|nr:peptidyl-prolyl cis-trans isomerase [Kiritimatiellia bacterium]